MTVHQETEIDLAELRYLSMTCADCGTMTIVDLEKPERVHIHQCPGCRREFAPPAHSVVTEFAALFERMKVSPHKISFRVKGA